jgi:hypothetical protein
MGDTGGCGVVKIEAGDTQKVPGQLLHAEGAENIDLGFECATQETPRRVRGGAGQGVTGLARAERGAGRERPGAKTGAGHEGRRNVAERFAARGTVFGRSKIGAQPVAPVLAERIDALHGRARHEGHNALPQRPASSLAEVSSPGWPKKFAGEQYERERLLRGRNMVSMKKSHKV